MAILLLQRNEIVHTEEEGRKKILSSEPVLVAREFLQHSVLWHDALHGERRRGDFTGVIQFKACRHAGAFVGGILTAFDGRFDLIEALEVGAAADPCVRAEPRQIVDDATADLFDDPCLAFHFAILP